MSSALIKYLVLYLISLGLIPAYDTCNRKSDGHTGENTSLFKMPEAFRCPGIPLNFYPQIYIKKCLLLMASNKIDGKAIKFVEFMG